MTYSCRYQDSAKIISDYWNSPEGRYAWSSLLTRSVNTPMFLTLSRLENFPDRVLLFELVWMRRGISTEMIEGGRKGIQGSENVRY